MSDQIQQEQLRDFSRKLIELMTDQFYADKEVLLRVKRGETTHRDYLYLIGRLNLNVNYLEE